MDKLWLEVAGRPVVAHTWQCFDAAACVDEIILVVREGMQVEFEKLAAQFAFKKSFRVVVGLEIDSRSALYRYCDTRLLERNYLEEWFLRG